MLVIQAPAALEPIADRVRGYDTARLGLAMRLTGLTKPGGPIRVARVQSADGLTRLPVANASVTRVTVPVPAWRAQRAS